MRFEITQLRETCPLPTLLKKMGLGECAVSSCRSPFREDEHPSFGIYQNDGRWFWKDFGAAEGDDRGDEIAFLAKHHGLDAKTDFQEIVRYWQKVADSPEDQEVAVTRPAEKPKATKPNMTGFGPGTAEQIKRLSALRGISTTALDAADECGFLVFGRWCGQEVYGLRDQSEKVLMLRRLDGHMFPDCGNLTERKSHAVAGSQVSWPVGILEAKGSDLVLMVEGLPDFLAAFDIIQREYSEAVTVCPVCMLSASSRIPADALALFKGLHVRIVPHVDEAGIKAAHCWQKQLIKAGAKCVDFVDLSRFGEGIKDLNDALVAHADNYGKNPEDWRLL
jgi:hypothetical protein